MLVRSIRKMALERDEGVSVQARWSKEALLDRAEDDQKVAINLAPVDRTCRSAGGPQRGQGRDVQSGGFKRWIKLWLRLDDAILGAGIVRESGLVVVWSRSYVLASRHLDDLKLGGTRGKTRKELLSKCPLLSRSSPRVSPSSAPAGRRIRTKLTGRSPSDDEPRGTPESREGGSVVEIVENDRAPQRHLTEQPEEQLEKEQTMWSRRRAGRRAGEDKAREEQLQVGPVFSRGQPRCRAWLFTMS